MNIGFCPGRVLSFFVFSGRGLVGVGSFLCRGFIRVEFCPTIHVEMV